MPASDVEHLVANLSQPDIDRMSPSSLDLPALRDVRAIVDRLIADQEIRVPDHGAAGRVIWITGLSGAGKTTLAGLLARRFAECDDPCIVLDGDVLRALLAPSAGHDREHRLRLARTYSFLCREIADRGLTVICATVSMFHSVQEWNRDNMPLYTEIYLRVPLAELRRRDPKGLYARASAGLQANIVGVDVVAEEPKQPDLTIDYGPNFTPADALARVVEHLNS